MKRPEGGQRPAWRREKTHLHRTLVAALAAAAIGLVAVGGIALFLGVPAVPSVIAGLVAAVAFGALVVGAARRAAGFDDPHS